jgi:hypothetical protein
MFSTTDLIRSHLYSNGVLSNDYIEIDAFSADGFIRAMRAENKQNYYDRNESNLSVVNNGYTASTKEISLQNYIDIISSMSSIYSESAQNSASLILPGIRYISDSILIFERPPTMKPYSYKPTYRESVSDESKSEEFFLPLPWQVYICCYDKNDMRLISVKMLYANSSLSSFDDNVYAPALLNFYSNGTLCRPFFESMEDIDKYPKNYTGIMASAYDWVWNSGTNFDITENISEFLRSKLYTQFEKYCSEDSDAKAYYNLLLNNSIQNNPTSLHYRLVKSFFYCLQQVPLEEISFIEWSNPSTEDFFYMENSMSLSQLLHRFIVENDLFVHEDNFDYEEHDEDCPEECIYTEDVSSMSGYHDFVFENTNNPILEKTVKFCAAESVKYLIRQGFYRNFSNQSSSNKVFNTALAIING